MRDIVGLYLDPSDYAAVLCVDQKLHAHARTQMASPMDLGYLNGFGHYYVCRGTTTLFTSPSMTPRDR
ncbi:MAG: hypothetical protein F4X12_13115 [Acidobacteriia bacterium]|nr:hypothetical protein [Terriglobia bacterium]